jgi:hypothetical protein
LSGGTEIHELAQQLILLPDDQRSQQRSSLNPGELVKNRSETLVKRWLGRQYAKNPQQARGLAMLLQMQGANTGITPEFVRPPSKKIAAS